ncbi:MAG: hypothetical protein LBK77_03420 [Spirochaetaceae bacterium]|nr:hypothetical protein [Spirochaetaceae bacterium]
MKKNRACFAVILGLLIMGCGISKEDLTEQVKLSIEETLTERGLEGFTVKDLTLIEKGKNEYRGLLEVESDGETEKITINVTVDGDNLMWEIVQ